MTLARSTGAAVLALAVIACGGSTFTTAGTDAGTGPADAGNGGRGTYCGPALTCTGSGGQQGTICCLAPPTGAACASESCGCNAAQLECSRDGDCGGADSICCLNANPSCPGGPPSASCVQLGQCGARGGHELCDPNDPRACVSCTTDVACVGLPTGQGFGICGSCR